MWEWWEERGGGEQSIKNHMLHNVIQNYMLHNVIQNQMYPNVIYSAGHTWMLGRLSQWA